MSIFFIIFLVSIFLFISIIGFKFYEFNTGKILLFQSFRIKIEEKLVNFYRKIIFVVLYSFKKTKLFLRDLPAILTQSTHYYWRRLSKKIDQFFIKLRHKK